MKINRLSKETSPYLQQHAENPVDWYPWSKEALAKAKTEKKPILLSIGYSACHWCHVMAHESFEDIETAKIMNKYFINIKVDREERPDLDKIYQTSQILLNQRSGDGHLQCFYHMKTMFHSLAELIFLILLNTIYQVLVIYLLKSMNTIEITTKKY